MAAGRYWRRPVALVLGADARWVHEVADALEGAGVDARTATSSAEATRELDDGVAVVVSASQLEDEPASEFLEEAKPRCPVIVVDERGPSRVARTAVLRALA